MNLGPHENISITFSFWWVSHGVPLKTLHSTCAYFFGFTIRAFDANFFEPLPNKSITGHLCMNLGPHENISITFLFGEFLMEYHWTPCIQLVPIFWFPIRAFHAYLFEPLPNKFHNRPFCAWTWGHMKTFQLHFFLVSFLMEVPLKTLHSTCAYFLVHY